MTAAVHELIDNQFINNNFFILHFYWASPPPKAGQFFMMKPLHSGVFLQRPISVFEYDKEQKAIKFLITRRGTGTQELSELKQGDKVFLTGPLGNAWADFLPEGGLPGEVSRGKVALVSGSVGIAPLAALVAERPDFHFDLFAGFRYGFCLKEEENAVLGKCVNAKKIVITAEDGVNAHSGFVTDFLGEIKSYDAVLGCGPMQLLCAIAKKCAGNTDTESETKNVSCFISLESRFACGVGACLGCSIKTVNGNRCCCKHGPIFPAKDIIFDGLNDE